MAAGGGGARRSASPRASFAGSGSTSPKLLAHETEDVVPLLAPPAAPGSPRAPTAPAPTSVFFYASDSIGVPMREALRAEEIARRLEVLAAFVQLPEDDQRKYLDEIRSGKKEGAKRLEDEALRRHPIVTGVAGLNELRLHLLRPARRWSLWAPPPPVEVLSGSVSLKVRDLSKDAAEDLVDFLRRKGELAAAVLSSAFKYSRPHVTPWIAATCETLAETVPDERTATRAVREQWEAASAESVVFRLFSIDKVMSDSHEQAMLMWKAINVFYLNVTQRGPLVRILFFDPKDRLVLSKLVTRIVPSGHSAILPRLSSALQRAGFQPTSSSDELAPPAVPCVTGFLVAWAPDVLEKCWSLMQLHYGEKCVALADGKL